MAEQDKVNAAVSVIFGVEISPGDARWDIVRIGISLIVAVGLGRTGVHESVFVAANDGAERLGIFGVIEIANYGEIGFGIGI